MRREKEGLSGSVVGSAVEVCIPIATKAKASAMTALSTVSAQVRFHIIEGATTRHCAASVKAEATRRGTLQCQNEEMRLSRVEGSGKRKH